jgi:hypothetical protein
MDDLEFGSAVRTVAEIRTMVERSAVQNRMLRLTLSRGQMVLGVAVLSRTRHRQFYLQLADGRALNLNYAEVIQAELSEPQPASESSAEPFDNGYCWQYPLDEVQNLGCCNECGRYWGASQKTIRCLCGALVYLT